MSSFRPTRDIDLLGYTRNGVENLVGIIKEVCTQDVQEDGVLFDPKTVTGERINEDADYEGVRLRFTGFLGKARIHMQIDVGFADVVSPAPVVKAYPVILPMPIPELRSYPPESMIAEKLQVMIYLGIVNSRMKDFYDIWSLAGRFEFEEAVLQEAIRQTFDHRNTDIPEGEPAAFSAQFAREKQRQWEAFLKTGSITDAPAQFELVLADLQEFILPVLKGMCEGRKPRRKWKAGGPWKQN
jgi:Nucleotidyl transferase AbiEii toxin, Type IV TA system